jgi:hypothetical protein
VHTTGALHRSSELRSEGFVSTQQWLVKAQGMSKQDATAMMARTRDMTAGGAVLRTSRHSLGGRTDLSNLVLLCAAHHHLVHEGRWTITADRHLDAGTRG